MREKQINVLHPTKYLFNIELQNALTNEKLYDKNEVSNRLGIYVVVVRYLNKDTNVLVFNYVWYPYIFLAPFLSFLINKNVDSVRFNEFGDNLILVNNDIFMNDPDYTESKYKDIYSNDLNDSDVLTYVKDNLGTEIVKSDVLEIIRFINKLNYLTKNGYQEMADIMEMTFYKDYNKFVKHFWPYYYEELEESLEKPLYRNINLINTTIFVLRDLEEFIKVVSYKGFKFTKGIKKWGGQITSMSAILNYLDLDFRKSLYNHNQHHIKMGLNLKYKLDKSKFSHRNIHMNIGNIRWYSTKRKTTLEMLNKDYMNKLDSKKSFKSDSEIYLYLSNYLNKAPLNEETERNIEAYLLNLYSHSLSEKKDTASINYNLFSQLGIKNYIIEAFEIIKDYLNNLKKRSIKLTKRVSIKTKSAYYLNMILRDLDSTVIVEMSLGVLAKIVNGYTRPNEDCIAQNVIAELGNTIIRSYYYSLYKKFICKNVDSFIVECKEYLNGNDLDNFSKDTVLKYISTLEKNWNNLEVYEIKGLVKNILSVLSDVNFNNIDVVVEYTLTDWKLDNKAVVDLFDNNLLFSIASIIIEWLKESNLIQENLVVIGVKDRRTYFIPSDNIIKILKQNNARGLSSLPLRIPMIVKPKLYSREITDDGVKKERLGGYLINDEKVTDSMIIPNWELKEPSKIMDNNIVYDLVNNLSSVEFKINQDVLDFIYLYGEEFELLTPYNIDLGPYKSKMLTKHFTELESRLSKLYLQENILGLAEIYSKIPGFYFPVRIDSRGRVNCISQYLNYQSNELAKSLLLFSKGEKLMKNDLRAIGYFKAYGANCFGNKLNKKSWSDRIKWVDENEKDIIDYTNGKLIKEADNKLLFLAFCIEYKKWIEAYNNIEVSYFITHLPIQLDATCNGFQHLCLLILDVDMAIELNLTESSMEDAPKDYYSFILIKLSEYFKSQAESNDFRISEEIRDCYRRLSTICLDRKTIKKALMTKPYNVSLMSMINYIKEHFVNISNSNKAKSSYDLVYQYKEDPSIILCNKDISLLATGLNTVLYQNFPKLKELVEYLRKVARIFNKLNLPIDWGQTSGLIVNNSYTKSRDIKLRPFSYDKSSFTLKVSTGKLDNTKNIRAFMPNLIHSLDANALAFIAKYLFEEDKEFKNFYAIHDCFAVTANNVENLIKYIKLVYIKMYSDDGYLRELNEKLIEKIKYVYGSNCFNDETGEILVTIDDKEVKLKFPNINYVLGTDLPYHTKLVEKSSYIIT